ncbi:DUF1203 domain-containing protein [Pseudooceanicola nanhaiensis]|uniref:DUF1203 domain-containing protein n=1 Tax=Pseudooceanicola nanhaiensis TaxID=375761 RepID=UPI001CD7CE09|nr:DUF1203 domain-containing protein [Pseudooceanicola nanhaiensis]MCA0919959.1 DUF1203 domain-containing protein [Pseudooceanicola nanhaiensis]
MTFRIHALSPEPFAPLFALSEDELAGRNALRRIVTAQPGAPCRVSLADAAPGETVLLLNYTHLPVDSPYQSRHAIYVREGATQAHPEPGEVPEVLLRRLISVRYFDEDDLMCGAEVVEGSRLARALTRGMAEPEVRYAHLHFAGAGCFAASVSHAA